MTDRNGYTPPLALDAGGYRNATVGSVKLTEAVTVKLTPDQAHGLAVLAQREGLSSPSFLRNLLADVLRAGR